jgi:hypothetical protein
MLHRGDAAQQFTCQIRLSSLNHRIVFYKLERLSLPRCESKSNERKKKSSSVELNFGEMKIELFLFSTSTMSHGNVADYQFNWPMKERDNLSSVSIDPAVMKYVKKEGNCCSIDEWQPNITDMFDNA